jgi:hypothetical protein
MRMAISGWEIPACNMACSFYDRDYQKLDELSLIQSASQSCSEQGFKIDAIIKLIQ